MKMLDFIKTEEYASMTYEEKLVMFKNDEYFTSFYADILSAALCHRRLQPIGQKQGVEELCVRTYEQALKYVECVRGARNPEVKIGEVTEDIATYYYNDSKNAIENNDDGILFSKTDYQKIEIGRVVEAIFIICTWDLIDNNDEGVVKQLREARGWIYFRESCLCKYLEEMNFWKQLADRIPDYRHPSTADLRRRVIELERHCEHLQGMYMEARAELDKEKEKINQGDDDETATFEYGRTGNKKTKTITAEQIGRIVNPYYKTAGLKKSEWMRILSDITGMSPTSFKKYLNEEESANK